MPQLAMPQGFRKGRLSYTVTSATGAKVEILLKQKAFRIISMGQHEGVSTWSKKMRFRKIWFVGQMQLGTINFQRPSHLPLPVEMLIAHFTTLHICSPKQRATTITTTCKYSKPGHQMFSHIM